MQTSQESQPARDYFPPFFSTYNYNYFFPARVFSEEEKEKPRTPSKCEKKRAHDEDQKNDHDRCPFTTRETFFWTCPTNEDYKDYNSQCSHGWRVESDVLLGEAVWQKELLLKKKISTGTNYPKSQFSFESFDHAKMKVMGTLTFKRNVEVEPALVANTVTKH